MMRLFLSFCFALMLAFTSQAMAVARGAAAATGQMVICNGDGTMTVYTDADGEPTLAPHICPDCVVSLALPEASLDTKAPSQIVSVNKPSTLAAQTSMIFTRLGPHPRAPPHG